MNLCLFGTTFSTATAEEVIAMAAAQPRSRARLIVTANVDHIVILSENAAFRKAYACAAARTLDGTPLVWLARLYGARGARRVTGHDLLAAALAMPPSPKHRVFLVCASDLVGARIKTCFVASGLAPEAVRTVSPPFGFENDETYSALLAQAVRAHGTTLLVMGVGAPKSEIWVDRHGVEMGAPVTLAVGDALGVAAGLVPRAPVLMQRMGLEWFFRFLHAPRRLFPRYFLRSWRFLRIAAAARGHGSLTEAMRRQDADAIWMLRPGAKPE